MSWTLRADMVDDLARGAAVLGTGGGGDPYIGALLAKQALAAHGPVEVITLDEIPADAQTLTVAMMGAPTVMVEKLPSLDEVTAPVTALGTFLGRPITHITCAEVGGVNSTIPVAAAAVLGLPLVDGDGMGRAFPELQMVLPTLYSVSASPLGFADEKGNAGVLNTTTSHWAERIARVACVEMGCSIMIAGFGMDGATAARALVPGSLRHSIEISAAITAARAAKTDPVAAAAAQLRGRVIATGKVVDVERGTTGGFARGQARIENSDGTTTLLFQNEHLIARREDVILTTTPDLIIVVDSETSEPITTEALRYGQRVSVLSAPSDPRWHQPEALSMVGPRYFGYDVDSCRFDGTPEPRELQ